MSTPTTLAHEIDLSDEQSLQSVIDFLGKYSSESLNLWQRLKYIQEKKISKNNLWPYQLMVNDRNNLKCVLFIFSSTAFHKNYRLLTENDKSKTRIVTLFSQTEDDGLLISLIQQCIPWSTTEHIIFFAIPHRLSSLIQNFIKENNLGKSFSHSFNQLELDKETFLKKTEKITPSIPPNIVIQPLSQSDALIVDDLWTYKSDTSLNSIKYEIEHLPTCGAYRDGELLSWALTKFDGSIGTVFTKPEARGLGLGTLVNFYVTSKLFEQGQQRAFCYIAPDNLASLRIFEKLGYSYIGDKNWLIFSSE